MLIYSSPFLLSGMRCFTISTWTDGDANPSFYVLISDDDELDLLREILDTTYAVNYYQIIWEGQVIHEG